MCYEGIAMLSRESFSSALFLLSSKRLRDELGFRLTGKRGPAWINRAATFAVNLPCIVPQEWIEPPTTEEEPPEVVERELECHPERMTVR